MTAIKICLIIIAILFIIFVAFVIFSLIIDAIFDVDFFDIISRKLKEKFEDDTEESVIFPCDAKIEVVEVIDYREK